VTARLIAAAVALAAVIAPAAFGQATGGLPGDPSLLPPALSDLALDPPLFRVSTAETPVARVARVARGTTIRFTLSGTATVTLLFERATVGRRSGGQCVERTKSNAAAKTCILWVEDGTISRAGAGGPNAIAFSGRIGKRRLRAGRHRVAATAVDSLSRSSETARAVFRVLS
jgi:hypothetical protein